MLTCLIRPSRKRRRGMASTAMVSLALVQAASGMVLRTAGRGVKSGIAVDDVPMPRSRPITCTRIPTDITEQDLFYRDDEDFELDMELDMDGFQELQRSTGSEILNDELQKQIDMGNVRPNLFLDAHMSDASYMEKVAMSSIPEQLPKPAVTALKRQRSQSDLNFSKTKVTPEQEVELGKKIQNGVELHRLRSDFEEKEGRVISRQEWTELAGLNSSKQLRKQVSEYRRAKQLLVSANMGLVHAIVKGRIGSFSKLGVSFEEVVQEGSLGLLRAAELFDPSRGLRFSTYATIWIKGTLSNTHVAETVTLPSREKSKWIKIVQARAELIEEKGSGGKLTMEELANHLGMQVTEINATDRKMNQVRHVMSLDYAYQTKTSSGTESGSIARLEDDKNFRSDVDLAERTQMHADVVAAMARNLDAREARLLRLRYGLADGQPRSFQECADAMGLSQSRVQSLAKTCLKKLRVAVDTESLDEYLLTIA
jgi:RNA polymerase sigma factor (sigma-70 family)